MCYFPSWYDDGEHIYYLTDKDAEEHNLDYEDAAGHYALGIIFPGIEVRATPHEDFPCPPIIARDIMRGRLNRLMEAGGYRSIHVNEEGQLHRENEPAIEYSNGTKYWYLNGRLHRENSPAVEWANGDKTWYLNGKVHRKDGPAVERSNGINRWFLNGEEVDPF